MGRKVPREHAHKRTLAGHVRLEKEAEAEAEEFTKRTFIGRYAVRRGAVRHGTVRYGTVRCGADNGLGANPLSWPASDDLNHLYLQSVAAGTAVEQTRKEHFSATFPPLLPS